MYISLSILFKHFPIDEHLVFFYFFTYYKQCYSKHRCALLSFCACWGMSGKFPQSRILLKCMLMPINTAILLSRMAQPILNVRKCIHSLSHDGYYQSFKNFGQFNLMEIKCLFTEFYFPCCWLFMAILICLLAFVVHS